MNQVDIDFKNKKVLVMGLGTLGGGIATTKWLIKHSAKVTVTDLKTKSDLVSSIKALGSAAKKIKFVLGKHNVADFQRNEIIVVNPAVPRESKFLKIAKHSGARFENEASLFFRYTKNPIIAVTGTRGKTTTVNWIYQLLKRKFPRAVLTGNSSTNPMLKALDILDHKSPVVLELSSWHLEFLPQTKRAPHVAVITNIYPDHLNRYRSLRDYALAKTNIFINQKSNDYLILNRQNEWTKFFLNKKPKAKIIFPRAKAIKGGNKFREIYGSHNLENLAMAVTAVELAGVPETLIRKSVSSLEPVKLRQEIIYSTKKLTVVNDTTATSPDATIAALKRFYDGNLFLIAGGTDKKLEFNNWASAVKKYIRPEHLFLLNGSATKKMIVALKKIGFLKQASPRLFENFLDLLKTLFKFE